MNENIKEVQLFYMSESEVQDMAECNEFLPTENEDSEDDCHD